MDLALLAPIKREYNNREFIFLADVYYYYGIDKLMEVLNDYKFIDFSSSVVVEVINTCSNVIESSTKKRIKYLRFISGFDGREDILSGIKVSGDKFLEIHGYGEARYKYLIRSIKEYIRVVKASDKEVFNYINDIISNDKCISFKWLYSLNDNNRFLIPLSNIKKSLNNNGAIRYYMDRGIIPYEYEYKSNLLQMSFNSYDRIGNDKLFVGEDAIISDIDFEVMANIYELIYNLNGVRDEIELIRGKRRIRNIK